MAGAANQVDQIQAMLHTRFDLGRWSLRCGSLDVTWLTSTTGTPLDVESIVDGEEDWNHSDITEKDGELRCRHGRLART